MTFAIAERPFALAADHALATKQSKNTVAVQIHRGVEKLAILFRIENEEVERQKEVAKVL